MFRPVSAGVDVARSLPQHHLRWRPPFWADAGNWQPS
jgi:hypothetical protein